MRDLTKSFGQVKALSGVTAAFHAGEIHAVLGENGAGKSTLMNLLDGLLAPDSGSILVGGSPVAFRNPADARASGIGMVHQHFMLVPALTVAENLALSALGSLAGGARVAERTRRHREIAAELGWDVPFESPVRELSVSAQQRCEILRVLESDPRIVILDEPSAVLSESEVEDLFAVLRQMRDAGRCVILIAHKLAEIEAVADRVTVLRQGRVVATARMAETSKAEIAQWMVGEVPAARSAVATVPGDIVLEARDVWAYGSRGEETVRGASLQVRAGEILGIGGVDGNGQTQLAEVLAGVVAPSRGETRCAGPISYVPEDRRMDGLVLELSVAENMLLGNVSHSGAVAAGVINNRKVREWAVGLVERFGVKTPGVHAEVRNLSGGNQQKVVVARAFAREPVAIIAMNPTRGLDFAATEAVHALMRQAAEQGAAIVYFSSDRFELAEIATRTVIMADGRIREGDLADALAGGAS